MATVVLFGFVLLLFLNNVDGQINFQRPFLTNSPICRQWNCISEKLGLRIDELLTRERYETILYDLLPSGNWRDSDLPDKVLNRCFKYSSHRTYTNTCPLQAVLHCTIDTLIDNCPEQNLQEQDWCTPIISFAGFNYLFSQNRFENANQNLLRERRPEWFLKNYFSSKCCQLPDLFNSSLLASCHITQFLHEYVSKPNSGAVVVSFNKNKDFPEISTTSKSALVNSVRVVEFADNTKTTENNKLDYYETTNEETTNDDPLQCCHDLKDLITKESSNSCNFNITFDHGRLHINNNILSTTTTSTTNKPPAILDVKLVPDLCGKIECVFERAGVMLEDGKVDLRSFKSLLDNMTISHPEWKHAKDRAITVCLRVVPRGYNPDCDINSVLNCVLDVITENCPSNTLVYDPCKRSYESHRSDIVCQISSSVYRPKSRRRYCEPPSLVSQELLTECELESLAQKVHVVHKVPVKKPHTWIAYKPLCEEASDSTKCILSSLGALNKYKFMDYFAMKNRLETFIDKHEDWNIHRSVILGAFTTTPLYSNHCSSPRKLLNALHAMLVTCPASKRKTTGKCSKMYGDLTKFLSPMPTETTTQRHHDPKEIDFDIFGLNVPPVKVIDIKPQVMHTHKKNEQAKVVQPVYKHQHPEAFIHESWLKDQPLHRNGVRYPNLNIINEDNRQ